MGIIIIIGLPAILTEGPDIRNNRNKRFSQAIQPPNRSVLHTQRQNHRLRLCVYSRPRPPHLLRQRMPTPLLHPTTTTTTTIDTINTLTRRVPASAAAEIRIQT